MLGRPALRSLPARFRILAVSAIALGISLPAIAALCDELLVVEEELASLRSSIPGLRADLQAKERRLANVRSWMPDAEAQQRLAEAKAAYEKAKSEEATRREEYQRVERQRNDTYSQLMQAEYELKNLRAGRADAEKLKDQPEVRALQAKVNEHIAFVRSQIGNAPASASQARTSAARVADTSHLDWLRADDLSVFGLTEFASYSPPSNRGADRSRLWALEQNLARQVNAFGNQGTRVSQGAQVQQAIRNLVDQVRSVRSETAARLNQIAIDMATIEASLGRTGDPGDPGRRPGYQAGLLGQEERDRQIAHLEAKIQELQATEKNLSDEMKSKYRALTDIPRLLEELRKAERAVTRASYEVRNADRRDLAEAEQEAADAKTRLQQAEERLPIALQEISHLRRLLNEKAAEINGVIAEARRMPDLAVASRDVGRIEKCDYLRTQYPAELQETLGQYNEEAACLSATMPDIPAEIAQIIASLQSVSCGVGDEAPPPADDPFPPAEPDEPSPPLQTGCGPPAPAGQTYVPAVANIGLHYQQAMAEVSAAGLQPFAFEFQRANTPEEDGRVTNQSPAACALVALGATVEISYNTNSVAQEPAPDDDTDTSNLILVPRVQDLPVDQARGIIAGANLTPAAFEHGIAPTPQFNGIVTWQRPMPGELVEPGRAVEIGYNRPFGTDEGPAPVSESQDPSDPGFQDDQQAADDPFSNPFPQDDQGLPTSDDPGQGGFPPADTAGGWERAGDLETVDESQQPPGEANPGGLYGLPPADGDQPPTDPAVEGLIRQAEAAAARCDFLTALNIGQQVAAVAPDHSWVTSRYPAIQTDEANYHAAKSTVEQARAILQRPEPTQQDIAQAADLARHVQSIAPICMSQDVSGLNGPIQHAAEAARQRNRESRQAGIAGLLGALGTVSTALNQGNTTQPPGFDPGGIFGQGGAPAAGPPSISNPAGVSTANAEPVDCNPCMVAEGSLGSGLVYLFQTTFPFSHASCGSASARMYELYTFTPDEDDQGRPLNYSSGAERYAAQKASAAAGLRVSKLCGPCQSHQQARNLMRSRCPRPNHNLQIGPGGATLDGRRIQ